MPMQVILRHKLLVGLAALVAAAGAAGGAYAATESSSNPQQAYLNDVAKRLNVSPSKLDSALKGALIDRLNAMVKSGRLTQAQANKIEQRLSKGGRLPFPGGFGMGRGFGPGRMMRIGGMGGPLHAAASYLGVSTPQLMTDLASGKSLAQVATKQGKSVSGLEQAIITAEKARLDKLVSAGVLTSAQEQRVLSRLSSRVDKLVNRSGHFERSGQLKGPMMPAPSAGAPAPPGGASGSGPDVGPPAA
jgi:ribosomal protein S20